MNQRKKIVQESLEEETNIDFKNLYYDNLIPHGTFGQTSEFLKRVNDLTIDHLGKSYDRKEKILDFQFPHELKSRINLEIQEEPLALQQILDDCKACMDFSIKTAHPRNFNQISQGVDIVSLAGEWVTAATNTNMFTYEVAPFYNLVEKSVLDKMAKLLGWTEPADGLFNPGGSISNLYAVQTALHFFFPQHKQHGLFVLPKLVMFTSEHSHYSMQKAATILGLGLENVRFVPVDERGKMDPIRLEELIEESYEKDEFPFFVSCTAGTTVLGAYDNIEPVAAICKKHKLWLHVDAAWGGGCLISSKHRDLMKGVDQANSVTWNPHKMMGALLQCAVFLVKKQGILLSTNEMNAKYLFQQDKFYDVNYDTGDKTIQCGRHVDVFKLWLMWRAKGDAGFEQQVNKLWELAALLVKEIKSRRNFELVLDEPEATNVCFWYIPDSIYDMDRDSEIYKSRLNQVAARIKEKMMMKGTLMVSYQPLDNHPNFFRMIFSNAATREEDVYYLLDEIERLAKDSKIKF